MFLFKPFQLQKTERKQNTQKPSTGKIMIVLLKKAKPFVLHETGGLGND